MASPLKVAGLAAVSGALILALAAPSQAHYVRHHKVAAVRIVAVERPYTYPAVTADPGSYYWWTVNPRFGYVPELGYSNAVMFGIYPLSD